MTVDVDKMVLRETPDSGMMTSPEGKVVRWTEVTQAMFGERENLFGAGCDGYIGKPVEPLKSMAQIEKFLSRDLHSSRHAGASGTSNSSGSANGHHSDR